MTTELILPYDTETTGLPAYKDPSDAPHQPHIVQIAAALVDTSTRLKTASMSRIVKPDGWVIPDDVIAVHGITNERAMDEGIPEKQALEEFLHMWGYREGEPHAFIRRLGYNESFDARIIRIAMKRYGYDDTANMLWKGGNAICAMRRSTNAKLMGSKFPKLAEAYLALTGMKMENAHTAMGDVDGVLTVWFGLDDLEDAKTDKHAA